MIVQRTNLIVHRLSASLLWPCISFSQQADQLHSAKSKSDENTVVRLFYLPAYSYFHPPLLFRAVDNGDRRLNTAPMLDEGRTVYISHTDLQNIIEQISRNRWQWQISRQVETPRRIQTGEITDKFAISISSSDGTSQTFIDPKKICTEMEPFDSAIHGPRALWEFKLFRNQYGCKVPGSNREEYPEHDVGDS